MAGAGLGPAPVSRIKYVPLYTASLSVVAKG